MNNITDIIKNRKSCRTYLDSKIDPVKKQALINFMENNSSGVLHDESFRFTWIERDYKNNAPMKLNYGTISNHSNYIMAKAQFNTDSCVNYGYALEKILLKASELGLATCWIGYFDPVYFKEITTARGEFIPSLIIIGNEAPKKKTVEKVTRFLVKADSRKAWKDLFYVGDLSTPLEKEHAGNYTVSLEMLRLAPSSGNSQPWRIISEKDGNRFHFYRQTVHPLYQKRKLHDVDMGICMAHFDLTVKYSGLKGKWHKAENPDDYSAKQMEYIASWSED